MRLVIVSGSFAGKEFEVEEGNNLVGRWDPETGSFPEIDLEQFDEEAKVSRKHCVIDRRGDQVTIEDIGSLNGTFVNKSHRLKEGERFVLKIGDEVMIGKIVARIVSEE